MPDSRAQKVLVIKKLGCILKLSVQLTTANTRRLKSLALLLYFVFGMQSALAAPTDDFVTTWTTDCPGCISTSIAVPMIGGPYDVDWDNDGTFDEFGYRCQPAQPQPLV